MILRSSILQLPLAASLAEFKKHIATLFAVYGNPHLRSDPLWGGVIPFDVPPYGKGPSAGYMMRLDMVLTDSGRVYTTETDLVGAGNGVIGLALAGVATESPEENPLNLFMAPYKQFYRDLLTAAGQQVFIAVPKIVNSRWGEEQEDARLMAAYLAEQGVPCTALALDKESPISIPDGSVVQRLFYRDEVAPYDWDRLKVVARESVFDSKAMPAVIHHSGSEQLLLSTLPGNRKQVIESLLALRRLFPYTQLRSMVSGLPLTVEHLVQNRAQYVLKGVTVEKYESWGAHSVVQGGHVSAEAFREALVTGDLQTKSKSLSGDWTVQGYIPSKNFLHEWNQASRGELLAARTDLTAAGTGTPSPVLPELRDGHVHGRISVFVLINRSGESYKARVVPYGLLTLRHNDAIVHGTSDSAWLPFKII